jgi:hypothetical protein
MSATAATCAQSAPLTRLLQTKSKGPSSVETSSDFASVTSLGHGEFKRNQNLKLGIFVAAVMVQLAFNSNVYWIIGIANKLSE